VKDLIPIKENGCSSGWNGTISHVKHGDTRRRSVIKRSIELKGRASNLALIYTASGAREGKLGENLADARKGGIDSRIIRGGSLRLCPGKIRSRGSKGLGYGPG